MRDRSTVVPFPAPRRAESQPDAGLVARARRQAWLAVCHLPIPTKLREAPPWHGGSPIVLAMWWQLRGRLWTRGPIAEDPRELAQAAHVTPRTWRRNAALVGSFFQRTETGAWFDPDLEAARQQALAREERRALRRLQRAQDQPSRQPCTAARFAAQDRRADDA